MKIFFLKILIFIIDKSILYIDIIWLCSLNKKPIAWRCPLSFAVIKRNKTPSLYIGYALYFYFSGLSLRKSADRLSSCFIKRNTVSIWNWMEKYKPKKILSSFRTKIAVYNRWNFTQSWLFRICLVMGRYRTVA